MNVGVVVVLVVEVETTMVVGGGVVVVVVDVVAFHTNYRSNQNQTHHNQIKTRIFYFSSAQSDG